MDIVGIQARIKACPCRIIILYIINSINVHMYLGIYNM